MRGAVAAALCLLGLGPASAQTVYVTSIGRSEAQVVINNSVVRALRPGQASPEGVQLVEIRGNAALLEVGGRQILLSIGQSTAAQTVLRADRQGHFVTQVLVNGQPFTGMIDTGATSIAMNLRHAQRLGLDLRNARRGITNTANGRVPIYVVTLAQVQVGDIVLHNVEGTVIEGGDERLGMLLIGMSFLRHIDMRRTGDTLTLTRSHLQ